MQTATLAAPNRKAEDAAKRWERARQYILRGYSAWKVSEICGVELKTAQLLKERYGND
jgi:hypothetical protein